MKTTCKTCKGTGTTGMHGAFEDAQICCDEPIMYHCDQCENEIDADNIPHDEEIEEYHICQQCDLVNNEPTEKEEWLDGKFPASEKR